MLDQREHRPFGVELGRHSSPNRDLTEGVLVAIAIVIVVVGACACDCGCVRESVCVCACVRVRVCMCARRVLGEWGRYVSSWCATIRTWIFQSEARRGSKGRSWCGKVGFELDPAYDGSPEEQQTPSESIIPTTWHVHCAVYLFGHRFHSVELPRCYAAAPARLAGYHQDLFRGCVRVGVGGGSKRRGVRRRQGSIPYRRLTGNPVSPISDARTHGGHAPASDLQFVPTKNPETSACPPRRRRWVVHVRQKREAPACGTSFAVPFRTLLRRRPFLFESGTCRQHLGSASPVRCPWQRRVGRQRLSSVPYLDLRPDFRKRFACPLPT